MEKPANSVINALQTLRSATLRTSLAGFDGAQVQSLIKEIRLTERSLTALNVKAGQRSDQLAADKQGPDAEESFSGTGDVSGAAARRDTDRSRTASANSSFEKALDDGTIGGEHLDSIARAKRTLDEDLQPLFDAAAGDLVDRSDNPPVDRFNKQMRRLADKIQNDHGLATAKAQRKATGLSLWKGRDGMGHAKGDFDLELYASLKNAIDRQSAAMAATAASSGEQVTKGKNLDALALVELVQHGNGAKGRAEITVVVDADTALHGPHDGSLRETVDGDELAYETVRRLCCDALIRKVVLDAEGRPIDVGRQYRTATRRQWVALKAVYSTCGWRHCDRPVSWCQAHHIDEWENGGQTDLDNLVPLCNRHHHSVHEGGWNIKLLPDRTLKIYEPDGTYSGSAHPTRATAPPGAREPSHN